MLREFDLLTRRRAGPAVQEMLLSLPKFAQFPVNSLHYREIQSERGSGPTASTATTLLNVKHADAVREIARVRAVLALEL